MRVGLVGDGGWRLRAGARIVERRTNSVIRNYALMSAEPYNSPSSCNPTQSIATSEHGDRHLHRALSLSLASQSLNDSLALGTVTCVCKHLLRLPLA